jgi:hypothetical protein
MLCQVCGKKPAESTCEGCWMKICSDCAKMDLHCYGCGCVYPIMYCENCAKDPAMNPYGTS